MGGHGEAIEPVAIEAASIVAVAIITVAIETVFVEAIAIITVEIETVVVEQFSRELEIIKALDAALMFFHFLETALTRVVIAGGGRPSHKQNLL